MSAFTCITCRVAFADADLQRGHYKTDWHRYNLKRKVAELPPVTAENFQQRVLAQRAQDAERQASSATYCTLCGKHFNTQNAYDNHVKSKKHRDVLAKEEQGSSAEVQEQNALNREKGVETETEKHSRSAAKSNTSKAAAASGSSSKSGREGGHKSRKDQAMAVDDDDVDSDSESVESWDGEALGEEECLFCSYISKSLEENVAHMTAKHSFFIPDIEYLTDLEGLIVYLGQKVGEGHLCLWCNEKSKMFTSIKSVQQHMIDRGHTKMLHEGDAVFEYADFYDYRSSYPDHEKYASRGGDDADSDADEEVETEALEEENYQLVLPSGSTIGHRSLQRYFRQKLKPTRVVNPNAVSKVIAQYKALGWTGSTGVEAQKRAKDVHYVQRIRARDRMQMGMKNNSLLQKHYRMQVIF